MRLLPIVSVVLPITLVSHAAFAESPPSGSAQPPEAPTSTSGTALMPLVPQAAPAPSSVPEATRDPNRDASMDARFKRIEARLDAEDQTEKKEADSIAWLRRLKLTGFVQPQLLVQAFNASASPNAAAAGLPSGIGANDVTAKADGTTTNGTFFRLRRARLKAEYMPTDYARFVFEIDPTPVGGPSPGVGTVARNVEAVGIAHFTSDFVAEYGLGIFKIPFGRELLESAADRVFIEPTWASQNLMPGEYDTGARAYGAILNKRLTGQLALLNGVTQGERTFAVLPDLNRGKDIVGRVNFDFGPADAGLSLYYGQGQTVDATALRFKQYPRTAINFEAGLHHVFAQELGKTRAMADLTIAQNLDRGTKYAFALPQVPANVADDVQNLNERGLMIRVEQELTEWVTLGARYDFYSPDTTLSNNARDTYSFVGILHFTKGLRLMVQFDHAIDNVHPATGTAPSKQIETLSTVLQARF